jgi:hypothetical protein
LRFCDYRLSLIPSKFSVRRHPYAPSRHAEIVGGELV